MDNKDKIYSVMSDDSQTPQPHVGEGNESLAAAADENNPGATSASADEVIRAGADAGDIHVKVEAFGSGTVLHEGLAVFWGATVADLRKTVLARVALPPRTRTVRLFVGHGGKELDDDDTRVDADAAALADQPLVVFPTLCTSHTLHRHGRGIAKSDCRIYFCVRWRA